MPDQPSLEAMPTGMTCEGVHRAVVEQLLDERRDLRGARMLDIPCGNGDLAGTLSRFFPGVEVRGCDLEKPPTLAAEHFAQVDASRPFAVFPERPFDYVFSVSGVMEFDNTLQFFESCHHHLREGGRFIVTNDNLLTLWDRLCYLLVGKATFQIFVNQQQGTWKMLPLHNLLRLLRDAGFEVRRLRYVSLARRNLLLLPLAALVYPMQRLYARLSRNPMPLAEKRGMYPFRSLLCRHYIVVCEKPAS